MYSVEDELYRQRGEQDAEHAADDVQAGDTEQFHDLVRQQQPQQGQE